LHRAFEVALGITPSASMIRAIAVLFSGVAVRSAFAAAKGDAVVKPKPPQQCGTFDEDAVDTDIAGTLVKETWTATIDGCCLMCEEEALCDGFAYVNQMCYLKADFAGTFHNPGVVTRLKKGLGAGCAGFGDMQQDADLVGDLLEDWQAPTPEVCCAACADKPDCQGYAFIGNRCYLKGNVRGTYAHQGCVVRVKDGVLPEGPLCPLLELAMADTDVAGALIAQHWAATSDDCCPMCEGIHGCESFSYLNQQCYFKGNFTGTHHNVGVTSRLIKGLGHGCPGFQDAEQGKDLTGRLLAEWSAPNSDYCCAACTRRPDCQGVAYLDGRCYLKGDVTGTSDHEGVVIRLKEGVLSEGGGRRLGISPLVV